MIKVILYIGTWMCMSKMMLVNVARVETDRSGYGFFSKKATLKLTAADGTIYKIRDMRMEDCRICMEKANQDMYLDLTEAMGRWIYIAEKEV